MTQQVELALGTVQFGLAYGVAGRGQAVPEPEVREILQRAWALGIRALDTAAAYGDIEARLAGLAGDKPFLSVSKLPPVPPALAPREAAQWAKLALQQAHDRLGPLLKCVLFHRPEDLLEAAGVALWDACEVFARNHGLTLGVSCYDPLTLDSICARFPVQVAQLPGNALDQRLRVKSDVRDKVEIHLRSCFLQGLLVMPQDKAVQRVPAAQRALTQWHRWCADKALSPVQAALSIAKGLPHVRYCVVGVDSLVQLEDIAAQWHEAKPIQAPELHTADAQVVDPRLWKAPA